MSTTNNNLVLIVAGHYCVSDDYAQLSHQAETEITSLIFGLEDYQYLQQQGRTVRLVLWVNDIGIAPLERKAFQQNYSIPSNYADLMREADISPSEVIIRFESQARNRASKLVRHLKKHQPDLINEVSALDHDLIRCVEPDIHCISVDEDNRAVTINDFQGRPLVIKENGAAKCCTILATFFSELEQQFQPIEIVAIFNVLYIERIKIGIYVAQTLFNFTRPTRLLFCNETHVISSDDYSFNNQQGNALNVK